MKNEVFSLPHISALPAPAPAADEPHTVYGTMRADELIGTEGDDRLYACKGNDVADGGGGIDTAMFYGQYANYTVTLDEASGRWTVTNGRDHKTLANVEFMQFADRRVRVGTEWVAKPTMTRWCATSSALCSTWNSSLLCRLQWSSPRRSLPKTHSASSASSQPTPASTSAWSSAPGLEVAPPSPRARLPKKLLTHLRELRQQGQLA